MYECVPSKSIFIALDIILWIGTAMNSSCSLWIFNMNLCSVSISASLYISRRPRQGGPAFFNTDVSSISYNNTLGGDILTNDKIRPNCILSL